MALLKGRGLNFCVLNELIIKVCDRDAPEAPQVRSVVKIIIIMIIVIIKSKRHVISTDHCLYIGETSP